jgi:hypothetical protein
MNKKKWILWAAAVATMLSGCGWSDWIKDRTDFSDSVDKNNIKCSIWGEVYDVNKEICEKVNWTVLNDSWIKIYISEEEKVDDENNTVWTPTIWLLPHEEAIRPENVEHYITFTDSENQHFDKWDYIKKYYSDISVNKIEIFDAFNGWIILKIDWIDYKTWEKKVFLDKVYFEYINLDEILNSLLVDNLEENSIWCDVFIDSDTFDLSEELMKNWINVDQLVITDFEDWIIFFDKNTQEEVLDPRWNFASGYTILFVNDWDETKKIKLWNMLVNFIR